MTLSNDNTTGWFPHVVPNPDPQWRLFCLAFAGGTAAHFRPWAQFMPEEAELRPVELPGRGTRFSEPLEPDMMTIAEGLAEAITPLANRPYTLFGHSMGSAIAFATAQLLEQRGLAPSLLVCSGRAAPHVVEKRSIHRLPDDGIRQEMIRLGGTPDEILENQDLMGLILPIVRNDFELIETYAPQASPLLETPIFTLCGRQDEDATEAGLLAWRDLTSGAFDLKMFDGDHFYLNGIPEEMTDVISGKMRSALHRLSAA